jgi:hypothetical protein
MAKALGGIALGGTMFRRAFVTHHQMRRRAYEKVSSTGASIGRYLHFHNERRPHANLNGMTPDQAYFTSLPSARQFKPGRCSTYRSGNPVQIIEASLMRLPLYESLSEVGFRRIFALQ